MFYYIDRRLHFFKYALGLLSQKEIMDTRKEAVNFFKLLFGVSFNASAMQHNYKTGVRYDPTSKLRRALTTE